MRSEGGAGLEGVRPPFLLSCGLAADKLGDAFLRAGLRTGGQDRRFRPAPTPQKRMILHPAAWLILFIIAAVVVWFTIQDD